MISVVTVLTFHVTIFIHNGDVASVLPHNTRVFNLCLIKGMGLESRAEGRVKGVKDTNYRGKLKYGKRKENSFKHRPVFPGRGFGLSLLPLAYCRKRG